MLTLRQFLVQARQIYQELHVSELFDESTFYPAFTKDLKNCKSSLIIESPFVANRRLSVILPALEKLIAKKVRIIINVRDPLELDDECQLVAAQLAVSRLQHLGIHVLFTKGLHRKVAIIDELIVYEGSLNILSQNNSTEIMRKIKSKVLVTQLVHFIDMDRFHVR